MKQIYAIGIAVMLAGGPASAQENNVEEGFDLLGKGMEMLLQGLIKEMGPALLELEGKIIDLNAYHFPEVLPNGDIIIRRKMPLVPLENGETDL